MSNYAKKWLKAAAVRAVKTVAQTAVATIGTAAVLGDVNWVMVASASALSGVLSLVTSGAGLPGVKGRGGPARKSYPSRKPKSVRRNLPQTATRSSTRSGTE